MSKMISIRLPEDISGRLHRLAQKTGRTKTYYAREAIARYLEDFEDAYLAETRYEDVLTGKSRTHSLDQVGQDLGLAD